MEERAVMAMPEREARGPESRMRKMRTRKAAAAEMRASAAAKTRASTHAAEMASRHAAGMHATSHAPAHAATGMRTTSHTATATSHAATTTAHAAATTTAASERRRRNSKRGAKRGRHEAPKDLVVHRNSPWLKTQRRNPSQKGKQPAEPNGPARTNYKCDSF
jgi:hypothetical protein